MTPSKQTTPRRKLHLKKAPAWSHQKDLESKIGQMILIADKEGNNGNVKLLAVDQFTIKVEFEGEEYVFFKSALAGYGPVKVEASE